MLSDSEFIRQVTSAPAVWLVNGWVVSPGWGRDGSSVRILYSGWLCGDQEAFDLQFAWWVFLSFVGDLTVFVVESCYSINSFIYRLSLLLFALFNVPTECWSELLKEFGVCSVLAVDSWCSTVVSRTSEVLFFECGFSLASQKCWFCFPRTCWQISTLQPSLSGHDLQLQSRRFRSWYRTSMDEGGVYIRNSGYWGGLTLCSLYS